MTKITFVKKIKKDGSPCRKCADVERRLSEAGLLHRMDQIAIADERDPHSQGMVLARKYRVDAAPFFVVEREGEEAQVYTVYFRFLKEVMEPEQRGDD